MLSLKSLKEFTSQYQTRQSNIVREYIQHLFLSSLYRIDGSEQLLFKGGTALRIIYQSPRFSEDLDFTGFHIYQNSVIDELFISAMGEVEKSGIKISFSEAKPTTGGYLGIIHYELYDFREDMKFEVSLRRGKSIKKELTNVAGQYLPDYGIWHLNSQAIVRGKIAALLDRQKPRDYYDLYFFLRHPELNKWVDKRNLLAVKKNLARVRVNFKKELAVLLPVSHHMILKDFKKVLESEINKYI